MQRDRRLQSNSLREHVFRYLQANGPILLILLASTAAFIYINQSYPLYRGNDERDYALEVLMFRDQAWHFWGKKFGYTLAVACVSSVLMGGDAFKSANVVAVSSSVLFLWATYLIFKNLFGRKIALLTTLATLTSSAFFLHGMASMTDMPFACLSMLSVSLLVKKRVPTMKEMSLAGVVGGLATITRTNGIVLLLFIPLWVLINPYHLNLKRRVGLAVAYLVPCLAIQVRWVWILLVSLTQKNVAFVDFFALLPDFPIPSALARSASMARNATASFPDFVDVFVTQFLLRLEALNALLWQPILLTTSLFLVILGMLLWLGERKERPQVVFLFYLLLHIGVTSVQEANQDPRLLLPLLPALCFFALFPFISNVLIPDFKIKPPVLKSRASLKAILLVLLLMWGAYHAAITAKDDYEEWNQLTAYKFDILRWLRQQLPSEDKQIVVIKTSSLEFLLGDYGIGYRSSGAYDDVWEYPEGASYLIFEKPEKYYDYGSPGFKKLEFPLDVSANLEPVWLDLPDSGDNVRAVVYRVWEKARYMGVREVIASSYLRKPEPEPALYAMDHSLDTGWTSQKRSSPFHTEWIAFNFEGQERINRVWLLPNGEGASFPRDFQIQVSVDGEEWVTVVEERDFPRPKGSQPQVFAFDPVECRFLAIVAGELGEYAAGENEYAMGFREVVLKLAFEDAPRPALSISPADVSYEPETGFVSARVWNEGTAPITATVRFYNEYPPERAVGRGYLAAVPVAISSGESASARVGALWPSGLYTVTVRVTEEGNVKSRQASKGIEVLSSCAITDTRAVLLPQQAVHYRFGERITLVGYTMDIESRQDEDASITLFWRVLAPVGAEASLRPSGGCYSVSVDLVDKEGSVQFGGDFPLISGDGRPASQFEQWEIIETERMVYFPVHFQLGTYWLKVGLYSGDTMEQLPVFDTDSMEWRGDKGILLTSVTIH